MVMVDMFDIVTVDTKPVRTSLRLVLLDVGITACLGEKDRQNFKAVFKAVVRGQVGALSSQTGNSNKKSHAFPRRTLFMPLSVELIRRLSLLSNCEKGIE